MSDDTLLQDLAALSKPLSDDETNELFEQMNNGSKKAREKLINYNIRLVMFELSRKFRNINYDKED